MTADDRARAIAEALHEQHVREFDWMKGDRWSNPLDAAECGNCQRWGRYAAAILAQRAAADPRIEDVRAALADPRWRDDPPSAPCSAGSSPTSGGRGSTGSSPTSSASSTANPNPSTPRSTA